LGQSEAERLRKKVEALQAERAQVERTVSLRLEAEREAIARDLHDHLGQFFTVVSLEFSAIAACVDTPPAVRDRIAKLRDLSSEAQDKLGLITHAIRTPLLASTGLKEASLRLLEDWRERSMLSFDLHVALPIMPLPAIVETVLYQVLQEAIINVVKHASATHVGVILQSNSKKIQLIIEDNGVGFVSSETKSAGSQRFGLVGIRERLDLIKGKLEVETYPGKGTTLLVHVPL